MNKYLKHLITIILELQNESEVEDFIKVILTPNEIEEIPLRLEIARLLKKGVPQREIAKNLGVGIATVSRGAKEIKLKRFKTIEEKL